MSEPTWVWLSSVISTAFVPISVSLRSQPIPALTAAHRALASKVLRSEISCHAEVCDRTSFGV
jgi:hypothetical protein